MFRQIATNGVVKKEAVAKNLTPDEALDREDVAVELSQEARVKNGVVETAVMGGPGGDGEIREERVEGQDGKTEAERLVESVGCPFRGQDGEAALKLFEPERFEGNGDENGKPRSHNGGDANGEEELKTGSGCPFAANASFVRE